MPSGLLPLIGVVSGGERVTAPFHTTASGLFSEPTNTSYWISALPSSPGTEIRRARPSLSSEITLEPVWKDAPLSEREIAIDFASQLALTAVDSSVGVSKPPSESQWGLTFGHPVAPSNPGVSPMRPISKDLEMRCISKCPPVSRRKWAQAMLLSDEFWKTIVARWVHLLCYRERVYRAGGYAMIAVCAFALIHYRQNSLQTQCVEGAQGNTRGAAKTAIGVDSEDVPLPLRHGFGPMLALVKITPTPLFPV